MRVSLMRRGDAGLVARFFVITIFTAYLCAAIFVAVMQMSLPANDLAYGRGLGSAFSDPFVLLVAGPVASIVGLAIFPVALICLRDRALFRCGVFVIGTTILFLLVATPLAPWLALVGSPLVAVGGLIVCRFSRVGFFSAHQRSTGVA